MLLFLEIAFIIVLIAIVVTSIMTLVSLMRKKGAKLWIILFFSALALLVVLAVAIKIQNDQRMHELIQDAISQSGTTSHVEPAETRPNDDTQIFNKSYLFSDANKIEIMASVDNKTKEISVLVSLEFDHKDVKREFGLLGVVLNESLNMKETDSLMIGVSTGQETGLITFKNGEMQSKVLPPSYCEIDVNEEDLQALIGTGDYQIVLDAFDELKATIDKR